MAVVILHVHKYEKKVTRKFKSGELHERHVIATWKLSQHSLIYRGKPRKPCVELAGKVFTHKCDTGNLSALIQC